MKLASAGLSPAAASPLLPKAARLAADVTTLGLGQLDLVLLHYPKPAPPLGLAATIAEQWAAISAFVAAGGARAFPFFPTIPPADQYMGGGRKGSISEHAFLSNSPAF